jgi:hypothetical protein
MAPWRSFTLKPTASVSAKDFGNSRCDSLVSIVGLVILAYIHHTLEDSYVVGRPALQTLESPQTQLNRPVLLREPLHSGFNRFIARSLID